MTQDGERKKGMIECERGREETGTEYNWGNHLSKVG